MLPKFGKPAAMLSLGAAAFGFFQGSAGEIMDSAMGAAFDNSQADVAFMGRNIGFSSMLGHGLGSGSLATAGTVVSSFQDYNLVDPFARVGPTAPALAGAGLGGLIGGGVGLYTRGWRGSLAGGLLGGMAGMAIGVRSTIEQARQVASTNFYGSSPYMNEQRRQQGLSTSLSTMNASGNIVLGMHNSRRG